MLDMLAVTLDAIKNGGGTYRVVRFEYGAPMFINTEIDFGYFVAKAGGVENLPTFVGMAETFLGIWRARHFYSGHDFGLWRDENGNWSIDESMWFHDRNTAIAVGRENDQRAIWDIEKGEEITL